MMRNYSQAVRIEFLFILKVANKLQLKFFIISYVNSLERRKHVAVLFS